MATYPVVHKETGEQKEVSMSISEWDQWVKDNPDWSRDWSDPTTVPGMGVEVGDWRQKLMSSKPGWKHVMNKVKKAGKRNPSITQQY
jgi:hypothetical protein